MRFRLLVQRNGFPPAAILWSSKGVGPDQGAGSENITVAQLLEQVNEVIPLESEDWGLEDYAVEVQQFECLHFSVLNHVLKEDDQVTIRPLQLSDRRVRRVSGRNQISIDGRHLIDGVAFGRPFLKSTNRPSIRIPSLKRPRLEYHQDGDSGNTADDAPLMLEQPTTEEIDRLFEDEEEYNGIADDDIGGELNARLGSGQGRQRGSRKRRRAGLGIDHGDAPLLEGREIVSGTVRGDGLLPHINGNRYSRRSSRSSTKSVRFDGDNLETPATVLAIHESDSDDDDFDPVAEVDSSDSSDKENLQPRVNGVKETSADDDTSSSGTSSSDSEDSVASPASTSSSDVSESEDSESESDSEISSEASSETSSESSSESSEASSVRKSEPTVGHKTSTKLSPKKATKHERIADQPTNQNFRKTQQQTPPHQGTADTKKRNARRKNKIALDALKSEGVLPQTATIADYKRHIGLIPKVCPEPATENADATAIYAKKQQLLQSIASDPVKTDFEAVKTGHTKEIPDSAFRASGTPNVTMEEAGPDKVVEQSTPNATVASGINSHEPRDPQAGKTPPSTSGQRRMKLDLEASRRFIFNSLNLPGLRPKTGAEANQKSAEKDAQGAPQLDGEQLQDEEPVRVNAEDDHWRSKIDLRAVECCQEGVKLSTPPFPFYQRWDPQQQVAPHGSRGKKRKRNMQQYYENQASGDHDDEPYYHDDDAAFAIEPGASVLDPNSSGLTQAAIDSQLLQDSNASTTNQLQPADLPELPADLASRKDFQAADAIPGAIIAFKHICLSQATNWSPSLSNYKTAAVESYSDDGALELTLARRDAEVQERQFDAHTGQRIYKKFEMPGFDKSEENDDGRYLSIAFDELIDAKLVAGKDAVAAAKSCQHTTEAALSVDEGINTNDETERFVTTLPVPMVVVPPLERNQEERQSSGPSPEVFSEAGPDPTPIQPMQELATAAIAEIAEEDRRDISLLMKEAGFRPDVHSGVADGLVELKDVAAADEAQDAQSAFEEGVSVTNQHEITEAYPQLPLEDSFNDVNVFEDPPALFDTDPIVAERSSEHGDDEVLPAVGAETEDSTFLPASAGSDSETRFDPDFPAPRRSSRARSSHVADESEPADLPLSRRTRSSVAPVAKEPAEKPLRQPARHDYRKRSSPKAKESSDFDFPSPGILLGPRTQPDPLPMHPRSSDVGSEPELPLSSPIRRGSKRRRAVKFPSPAASDTRSNLNLSDMFAPPDEDASSNRATTSKGKAPQNQAAGNSTAKGKTRGAKADRTRRARVVDLTLSSDPPEESEESNQVEAEGSNSTAKGLPKGPGWVRKSMGDTAKSRTPARRNRSSV